MNIVILTIILPFPLNSGGAQAQYNMIDRLRHKHKITVVFPENGMNTIKSMHELQKRWPEVEFRPYRFLRQLTDIKFMMSKIKRALKKVFLKGNDRFMVEWMLTPYGYSVNGAFSRFMKNVIKEASADIVQVEFYPYLNFVHKLPTNVRKVFIHHELRYIRNRRLLANIELLPQESEYMNNMFRQEIEDLNCYDTVVTLTATDSDELKKAGVVVPIVVSPASVNAEIINYEKWNGRITFLGGAGHTPNKEGVEWFLKEVVPLVDWLALGVQSLDVIGGGWPMGIETMANGLKIRRLGFVENLGEAVRGSIMIVPILSGSGMRMKILEAAAMGLPMVTTTVGVEGLSFKNSESCLIADTPEEFAHALAKLAGNENLRVALTNNARNIYEEKYSVDATSMMRDAVYTCSQQSRTYK